MHSKNVNRSPQRLTLTQFTIAQLAGTIFQMDTEIEQSQKKRNDTLRKLAIALEAAEAHTILNGDAFNAKWRELLDTTRDRPDRMDRLDDALKELLLDGHAVIWSGDGVRMDNRQALLRIYIRNNLVMVQHLYQTLLSLLPALVNNDNPDEKQQAAILNPGESLILIAHLEKSRFELVRVFHHSKNIIYKTTNLQDMLDYLVVHHLNA
jgi:hypothetical protein